MRILHDIRLQWRAFRSKGSFALNELDLKLAQYLPQTGGFFIEAGANDGLAQSNTFYFERYKGWNGLLIEPIPDLAKLCRANRPRCLVENAALVGFDYPDRQIEMEYCDLMSLVKGAMKSEKEIRNHIETGSKIQQVKTYKITVPARTISSILDEHKISRIDLFSLDVEGFELQVLKGLDLSRHRPEFMLIEARYRNELDEFLKQDYQVVAELSSHDVLYRNKKS